MPQQFGREPERDRKPPYSSHADEPGERITSEVPGRRQPDDRVVSISSKGLETHMPPPPESDEEAGEPLTHTKRQGGAFDDPQAFEREPRGNYEEGETTFTKIGGATSSSAVPRDPASRGVGPLPVHLFIPLVLLAFFIVAFLLYRWL
jgi:hypothetical protein